MHLGRRFYSKMLGFLSTSCDGGAGRKLQVQDSSDSSRCPVLRDMTSNSCTANTHLPNTRPKKTSTGLRMDPTLAHAVTECVSPHLVHGARPCIEPDTSRNLPPHAPKKGTSNMNGIFSLPQISALPGPSPPTVDILKACYVEAN